MCNCENATGDCDHGKGDNLRRCERQAGKGFVAWIGPVCDHCLSIYDGYNKGYVVVNASGKQIIPNVSKHSRPYKG